MNREEYRDICRMTEYRVARLMTQEQLVRRLSEIREYAVEAMLGSCAGCVEKEAEKPVHCAHCSRSFGDFYRRKTK
ncbi:MAG: hypothetical protein HFJ84_08090 [Clostridiales bacterium]|jgi:hypothetical protein|nr:hypothetical protein [Clostridiales bacterium]